MNTATTAGWEKWSVRNNRDFDVHEALMHERLFRGSGGTPAFRMGDCWIHFGITRMHEVRAVWCPTCTTDLLPTVRTEVAMHEDYLSNQEVYSARVAFWAFDDALAAVASHLLIEEGEDVRERFDGLRTMAALALNLNATISEQVQFLCQHMNGLWAARGGYPSHMPYDRRWTPAVYITDADHFRTLINAQEPHHV